MNKSKYIVLALSFSFLPLILISFFWTTETSTVATFLLLILSFVSFAAFFLFHFLFASRNVLKLLGNWFLLNILFVFSYLFAFFRMIGDSIGGGAEGAGFFLFLVVVPGILITGLVSLLVSFLGRPSETRDLRYNSRKDTRRIIWFVLVVVIIAFILLVIQP